MQFASGSEHSALPNVEQVNERLRQFWRLRRHAEPADITFADQYVEEPRITPLDSTKTFVGSNGTYYDERWRYMEWRNRRRDWNWAAALSFGGWLAYRRMYLAAALFVVWLGLLIALGVNGVLVWPLALAQLVAVLTLAGYGNALYMMRFRRAALEAAQSDGQHQDRLDALARAGGTSRLAVYVMATAGVAVVSGVVAFTWWLRGGLLLNY
ncbi:MAG TPA: DUF2628 domain-containing protein [Geminicoccaceae bacterium]|nr:DUF2628 domain-containing protein [Geminicoccaceae bacterium]